VIERIEQTCWDVVEEAEKYSSPNLVTEDVKKLWQIFNRVSLKGSYTESGPTTEPDEINWLMEKIAANLGKTWVSGNSIKKGLSFKDFLQMLDVTYFATAKPVLIRQCIEDLHSWLVKEVLKIGWLNKRTRKQANWTNWLKRWFILTPTGLAYYDSEACKNKKGEVLIDEKTRVESQPDFTSITKKLRCRFLVSNLPDLEIELTANSELEKQQWISNVQTIIESAKSGLTPMGIILQHKADKKNAQKKEEAKEIAAQMSDKQEVAKRASAKMSVLDENQNNTSKAPPVVKVEDQSNTDMPPPPSPISDGKEEYDNNPVEVQKEKIKVVFQQVDRDGNGKIDKEEFFRFIQTLGLAMNRKESDLVFDVVDSDDNGYICFIEFYEYFVKSVLGEASGSPSESRLRAAFLAADRDGSGTVNFREFAEYAQDRRRDIAMTRLFEAFEQMDKDQSGEITFKEFRQFFSDEARASISALGTLSHYGDQQHVAVEDMFRGVYNQADATQLATYLRQRWRNFASFKRTGATGDLVMKGAPGMVDDVVPGEYALIDLACFNDLPPIEPRHVTAKVTWIKSTVPGKSGRLLFSNDFEEKLPTVIATNETLSYYGASLADQNQLKVSLLYRHGIQDFTYENNYLEDYVLAEGALGGAGIEKHGFAHLDCPLDDDSGFFVMGKMEADNELHLTAFKIPTRHTLYVPPFTIHSNDYLRGTWRTMLSDEVEIDHVQLVKFHREGKVEAHRHFEFSFEPLK